MSPTNSTTLLAAGVRLLDHWQELSGAIIGGLLGVVGALIVARGATNRERRNASRMLQHDLLNVTAMVSALTYERKVTLETIGAESLARNLSVYHPQLSPLFESQMIVITGADAQLGAFLSAFHSAHAVLNNRLRLIPGPGAAATAEGDRALAALPQNLDAVDQCAQAALYLLSLHELGGARRLYWRLRRRLFPDDHDRNHRALIKRLMEVRRPRSAAQ